MSESRQRITKHPKSYKKCINLPTNRRSNRQQRRSLMKRMVWKSVNSRLTSHPSVISTYQLGVMMIPRPGMVTPRHQHWMTRCFYCHHQDSKRSRSSLTVTTLNYQMNRRTCLITSMLIRKARSLLTTLQTD